MPDKSAKKQSQSLADLVAESKRLREQSSTLNAKIAKLDETIADEAAALVLKIRARRDNK